MRTLGELYYTNFIIFHFFSLKTCFLKFVACVAGGIVSAREIKFWRRSRQASGEAARRMGRGTLKYRLPENLSFLNAAQFYHLIDLN